MNNEQAEVGDVTSKEIGSGARFNEGKPDYSMMFLDVLGLMHQHEPALSSALIHIGEFQRAGHLIHLTVAHSNMMVYGADWLDSIDSSIPTYTDEDDFLTHTYILDPVIEVWKHGAKKYALWNWAKGMLWSVPIGCIARHALDILERGHDFDDESGQPHWAHIICNIQMLMHFVEFYPKGNDLFCASIEETASEENPWEGLLDE